MSSHIYHGPWVNWSHGGLITGATITLSDRSGGLLTSFIATFVTLVGAQLWKILSFAIHQIRSTTKPEDGLFHQQQVVWRNTAGAGGAAWTFLQQSWFWRKRASGSFLRTFSWAVFATFYVVLFALAAIFSSEISKAPGLQRLLIGDSCGYWYPNATSPDRLTAISQRQSNFSQIAATYARACYGGSFDPLQCSRYSVSSLSWDFNANATCPFQSGMCIYGDTAAFQMTSKLIDSQTDLGINTPEHQRLQLQKMTTCAPIHQKGFIEAVNKSFPVGDGTFVTEPWWEVFYGPSTSATSIYPIPYTESVSLNAFGDGVGYQLSAQMAFSNQTESVSWNPIPSLFRNNADMVILFLKMNTMQFPKPVFDPWFAANYSVPNNLSTTWYVADYYITTLGCAEQYRFCNPNNNQCTDYLGSLQLLLSLTNDTHYNGTEQLTHLDMNNMQASIAARLYYAASHSSVYFMTNPRGANGLRAQETVNGLAQMSELPPTQWHNEISSWFDGGLAAIQQHTVEYATGPSEINSGALLNEPSKLPGLDGLLAKYQCYSQIIKDSSETMSFSVLGMTLLFIIGGIIILTSLVIDRVVAFMQQRLKFNLQGRAAWMLDDKLQMQKTVFQNAGMGKWREGEEDAVPVTIEKTKFPRFGAYQLLSPNNPDGPEHSGNYFPTTEYVGASGKEPGVYVQQ